MKEAVRERRHFTRLPISLRVRYNLTDDASRSPIETISRNISQGGILFPADKPLPVSTKLSLEISSPRLSKPISVEGKVVWVEEIKEKKLYDVGIIFTKIAQNDASFIRRYIQTVDLNKILNYAVANKASDVHLVAHQPPIMRIAGALTPMQVKELNPDDVQDLIYGFLTEEQARKFEKELELDTSYTIDEGRFRVNIHKEKGQIGAAFRSIPTQIRSISELGLPPIVEELARKPNGLILVTGPTGCGKSTTLAAMIELINKEKHRMIISLEDPIEYVHKPKKSIIKQREIGSDSVSFIDGLTHIFRQDVDIILIGEMRDLASISIALTAAETGHLVLSTLHTSDTGSSINRIIDIFPPNQQLQIRLQLSECLRGIISQVLIPREDKPDDRAVATEILVVTPGVANLIRKGEIEQIQTAIEVGGKYGMHLMDVSLERLYKQGLISRENAMLHAKNPDKFNT